MRALVVDDEAPARARLVRLLHDDGRFALIQLHAVVRFDALSHGDAIAELDDGSSVIVSRTHRDSFLTRWRGR